VRIAFKRKRFFRRAAVFRPLSQKSRERPARRRSKARAASARRRTNARRRAGGKREQSTIAAPFAAARG
jgi:hypothetical protein